MPAERVYVPAVPPELMTADELLRANLPDRRAELIRGVLVGASRPEADTGALPRNWPA